MHTMPQFTQIQRLVFLENHTQMHVATPQCIIYTDQVTNLVFYAQYTDQETAKHYRK